MTNEEITKHLTEMDVEQDQFWKQRRGQLSTENLLQLKALVRKQIKSRGLPVKALFSISNDRREVQIEYQIEEPSTSA